MVAGEGIECGKGIMEGPWAGTEPSFLPGISSSAPAKDQWVDFTLRGAPGGSLQKVEKAGREGWWGDKRG